MSTITIYRSERPLGAHEVLNSLSSARIQDGWIKAMPSKFSKHEIYIQYCFWESVEDDIRRIVGEDPTAIIDILKEKGKNRILRRVYCFINTLTKTLEIYRGHDAKTEEIVSQFEGWFKTKFTQISLTSDNLQSVYSQHATELKQAMFKNVEGLIYEMLRGNQLEANGKFREYLQKFPACLRVISFRPKIRFINGNNKYQVTVNGDKGTVKISENGEWKWRPRSEIRQIVFMLTATLGLLAN